MPCATVAEILESSNTSGSYRNGERSCSRKQRSRRETLATLASPRRASALWRLVRNSTPVKLASSAPVWSRNVKFPFLMLKRRTSGAIGPAFSSGDSILGAICFADEKGVGLSPEVEAAGGPDDSSSVLGGDAIGAAAGDLFALGKRHFPSVSCGQTTVGFISATSVSTRRGEKSDRKLTRRRNVFASKKCLGLTGKA